MKPNDMEDFIMKHRRNRKTRRKIELIIKMGVFIFIMTFFFIPKESPTQTTDKTLSEISPMKYFISVPNLSQKEIPTGCESVSTVALLQYFGIDITVDEFIESYLPRQGFYRQDGLLFGPNPHEYFVGNPYSKNSLGCYPKVILKALNSMKIEEHPNMKDLTFKEVTGIDLQTLALEYIQQDIPILLWITIDMKPSHKGMQYYLEDGTLYTWTAQEHCVVLCGYDEQHYYLMDPLKNGEIVSYAKELVEKRYEELGKYGIVIIPI